MICAEETILIRHTGPHALYGTTSVSELGVPEKSEIVPEPEDAGHCGLHSTTSEPGVLLLVGGISIGISTALRKEASGEEHALWTWRR